MTTTPNPAPAPALDRLFTTLRRSPVTRSQDRVVAGVCAGIAERLGVSTTIVRVATVVLALMGPAFVLYLVAWLFLPDSQGRIRFERAVRAGETSSIVLLVLTVIAVLPDAGMHARLGWLPVVVIGAVVYVAVKSGRGRRGQTWPQQGQAASQQPAPSETSQTHPPQDAPRA